MSQRFNWDPCVGHRGDAASSFIAEYFASTSRRVLLIAGAGFDPRSSALCKEMASVTKNLQALFIQEQRPNPTNDLVEKATENIKHLIGLVPSHDLIPFEVFGSDSAVIGGRNVVKVIHQRNFEGITDLVLDVSAMSVGTSFPVVRYLVERIGKSPGPRNLHLFVMPNAELDESIIPIAGDKVGFIHGFKGGWAIEANASAAKLWLPQLARGRRAALQRIHDFIVPHDTCPILPFPSTRPRLCDELAEHYLNELESAWSVDPRNVIYAAEDDPLDLYRTILRIDDLRLPVFKEIGGSHLILSPTGSKVLALGAMMAALERDLPVAYLESIGYDYKEKTPDKTVLDKLEFIHIWLEGDVYTSPRGVNMRGGVAA